MNRRQFLRLATAAALPALSLRGRLFAASADSPRLLFVFLRGGYDCNHLLVPYASDFYYEARPTLALPRPGAGDPNATIPLDADWGLNPALRDSLFSLWESKQVAFIPFAGTDDLSRSHFETQDRIECGEAGESSGDYRSGFLARLSNVLTGVSPIAFTDNLPLSFRGSVQDVPNLSLKGDPKARFDERQSSILSDMYQDTPLAAAAREGLALRRSASADWQRLDEEMAQAGRDAPNTHHFATEGRRIAALMRDRYRLGFVDVSGWDTHVNQGGASGPLSTNLRNLGEGLTAFARELGEGWRDTVVVVVSEFGRTFRENGDKGTDHGHGTVHWVLGGRVCGGRIAGEQVAVNEASLFQNRDYPVLNHYRNVYAGLFGRLWGLRSSQVQTVFPRSRPIDLGLV
ncbi:DUF1501 domain-containing protein [Methylacidimicrobium sp. B4]|uniref:DUF1501 domain-containing protein n=1 Tax=Methylacidimicrobium sp. B4 TaxID=2796139 RepID=UPI001A8CF3CD|nr:DUF1501 domain-containing protein [Methylacidimicrobium sp. B4]QSR85162.1 DUF1501 domain-containing protein [Methylacidimicrobium sp. B4]